MNRMPARDGQRSGDDPSGMRIFLIASEQSGDRLGAALMDALQALAPAPVIFSGVGGGAMAERGLRTLFPIDELAINGFSAIPARLPLILRRIREAADAVIAGEPDALVIIDSPDFTHRVARRVRAAAPHIPIVDYVSPTVWAWRPGRAPAMRHYVDHVLALLPFEPEAMHRLGGPPCSFVGHPLAEAVTTLRPSSDEAARRAAEPPLLLVLPGSRSSEIRRHLATFGAAIGLAKRRLGAAEIVLPTVPHLAERIRRDTAAWPAAPRIVVEPAQKWAAFRQARAALAASGTVTLELALAQVPTIVAYKVTLVEELIARAMVKVKTVGLANIILGEMVMPELLQWQATAKNLADALIAIVGDTPQRRRQCEAFARLDTIMEIGGRAPSERAAAEVIALSRKLPPRHATGRHAAHE
ncbi:MAG TPA: lipid-A-disaccharide synthase [Xanthobacteraceae bacterium]|nr:lipid-A-disaccharide synthase [Xanthobacteraceae bacterium]